MAPGSLLAKAMSSGVRESLLNARDLQRALQDMSQAIVDFAGGTDRLVLVGIQRRGVQLADRIAHLVGAKYDVEVPRGALDITLYRDDLGTVGPRPLVGETRLPAEIEGHCVIIVDDVLYTGRTVRAALNELTDFGRPDRIGLAVLVDRGGRELPIQADVIGTKLDVARHDHVDVMVRELDGTDAVEVVREANR